MFAHSQTPAWECISVSSAYWQSPRSCCLMCSQAGVWEQGERYVDTCALGEGGVEKVNAQSSRLYCALHPC